MAKNVPKRAAQPTHSIAKEKERERACGLTMICSGMIKITRQTAFHDPSAATNNRYLELADIALGNKKVKKKSQAADFE